jgi:hypothetical protein
MALQLVISMSELGLRVSEQAPWAREITNAAKKIQR